MGIRKFKKKMRKFLEPRPLSAMRLGASYSVWNGEELLESSLRSIRPMVDYINVVWQRLSWHGNEANPSLEKTLNDLLAKGLIDKLIYFEPNLSHEPSRNETRKRNVGLVDCQKNDCTHFITMDIDEFFEEKPFIEAKKFIIDHNITHSACNMLMYVNPFVRSRNYAQHGASFIYRVDNNQKLIRSASEVTPWILDPTQKIPIKWNSRIFFFANVVQHHYYLFRKDLNSKVSNCGMSEEKSRQYFDDAMNTIDSVKNTLDENSFLPAENIFGLPATL